MDISAKLVATRKLLQLVRHSRQRLVLHPVSLVTSVLIFLAMIGVTHAQDLCMDIGYLVDQSQSEFVKIVGEPNGDSGDYYVTRTLSGASYCFVTMKSKRNRYYCGWEFPYRAKHAYDIFDEFVREMNECIGQHATVHTDQSVNHPDYYSLHRYEMEQAEVSVSVKDKVSLGKTFIFIRVQRIKR